MRLFDTHAHLNDARFDPDREEVLERGLKAGVERLVEIADSPAEWDAAIALSRARPRVRCALGLHPIHATELQDALEEALPRKARLPEVVAVGEIGLDYVKSPAPPELQTRAFERMLRAARRLDLPVVVHCRRAYGDLLPILERHFPDRPGTGRFHGVLHCFSAGRQEALAAVRLGFALGVDGPVTYPKNEALREAVRAAGLENVVLETDSPYLPPQSSRGLRNEPAALVEIAGRVAEIFALSPEETAERTTRNACELFRIASPRR